jgi:hypothetical protein
MNNGEIELAKRNARQSADEALERVEARLKHIVGDPEKIRALLDDKEFATQFRRWRENVQLFQSLP